MRAPDRFPASVPDDPVLDPAAPWLPRWRAAAARNARDRFVQIATVSPQSEPEVRTVVLRGLARDGRPYLFGDARAAKHAALRAGSHLELCVWWNRSGEQFRLRGPVRCVASADDPWGARRRELWLGQGEANRALFLGDAPRTPLARAGATGADRTEPPPWFVLYLLEPRRVDRLELGEPQRREIYALGPDGWRGGPVVP